MSVTTGESLTSRQLGSCATCNTQLPLRFAGGGEQPSLWLCAKCGARYVGVIDKSSNPEHLKNVVPDRATSATANNQAEQQSNPPCFGPPQQLAECATAVPTDRLGVLATARNEHTDAFDATVARGKGMTAEQQGPPFKDNVSQHGTEPFHPETVDAAVGLFNESLWQISDLLEALKEQQEPDLPGAERVARSSLESAAADLDLLTSLGINSAAQDYPTRHSLQVSNLAMAIGVTLGYDEWSLVELSTGCLLHDAGMLKVDGQVWQSEKELRQDEFSAIANHPCNSVAMLGMYLDSVPFSTRMVVYQTHERINGTGYPRGCRGQQIHELAKVAAVADAFVALVSPRPHRKSLLPYHAMAKLLKDVKSGHYDARVVRALLKTVSLFPLGSYVSLNDGRIARVMRSNGEKFTLPVVEAWRPSECNIAGEIVDISRTNSLKITEPLAQLPIE